MLGFTAALTHSSGHISHSTKENIIQKSENFFMTIDVYKRQDSNSYSDIWNEKDAIITGTLCELPTKAYGKFYYVVEVNEIDHHKSNLFPRKIRISTSTAIDIDVYETIEGKVHFFLPESGAGYSSRSYYLSKGISLFAF